MLQTAKEYLSQVFMNKKFLIILAVTALFIALALYVYTTYIAPRLQPTFVANREFVSGGQDIKDASVYFFSVDWCPFSKKAKPVWEAVKKNYDGKKVNGVTLAFVDVDGDKQDAEVAAFEKEHNVKIDGFPTIYLVKGDTIVEYDAKPEEGTLTEFLNTAV